jgi:hypothetical protein
MSTDPGQIRQDIEETRNSQDVRHPGRRCQPGARSQAHHRRAGPAIAGAKDKLMGGGITAGLRHELGRGTANVGRAAEVTRSPAAIRRQASGNPLAVGLIAVGIGWLVGSLLPASGAGEQAATKFREAAAPAVTDAAKQAAPKTLPNRPPSRSRARRLTQPPRSRTRRPAPHAMRGIRLRPPATRWPTAASDPRRLTPAAGEQERYRK